MIEPAGALDEVPAARMCPTTRSVVDFTRPMAQDTPTLHVTTRHVTRCRSRRVAGRPEAKVMPGRCMLCFLFASFDVIIALDCTSSAHSRPQFRVCGQFCGPGWCGGQKAPEGPSCNFSVDSGQSCGDQCCKLHDQCCGGGGPAPMLHSCNCELIACVNACSSSDLCDADGIGLPSKAILIGMQPVEDWCCGAPCPGENFTSLPVRVHRLRPGDPWARLAHDISTTHWFPDRNSSLLTV